jgi:acylaminoacyl-peptidase
MLTIIIMIYAWTTTLMHFYAHTVIGKHPTLFNAASLRNPVISVGELATGTDIPDWVYAEFGVLSDSGSYTPPTSNSNSNSLPSLTSNSKSLASPSSTALNSMPLTPTPPPPLMTPKTYNTLFTASPIAHVDNIIAPVLIIIGEDDLRVVPGQGIGFYHAIKGRVRTETGTRIGDENENGNGTRKEKSKGIVEMLSFPGESHAIDGVEAARVSFEATRDWFKVFAEG